MSRIYLRFRISLASALNFVHLKSALVGQASRLDIKLLQVQQFSDNNRFKMEIDKENVSENIQPVVPSKKAKTIEEASLEEKNVVLKFAKITENAFAPKKGSSLAAGYDLRSAYDYVVPSQERLLVKTDIKIAVPNGCYGRVAPRSGLAVKNFIDVGAGVIDQDYRGNVGVVMFNFGKEPFIVKKGDRIAQLILERIYLPELLECQDLEDTDRGTGGFGSTGTN